MYEFIDRPVTSLDRGGRFLIWATRSWVKSMHDARCPCTSIGPAFAQWKMIAGLPHFHMMMMILNRDALETFRFAQLQCNRIREHEALILSFVYGMRMSRPEAVRATLALVVDEDSITSLVTAVASLGRAMADADIFPCLPDSTCHDKSFTHE